MTSYHTLCVSEKIPHILGKKSQITHETGITLIHKCMSTLVPVYSVPLQRFAYLKKSLSSETALNFMTKMYG